MSKGTAVFIINCILTLRDIVCNIVAKLEVERNEMKKESERKKNNDKEKLKRLLLEKMTRYCMSMGWLTIYTDVFFYLGKQFFL